MPPPTPTEPTTTRPPRSSRSGPERPAHSDDLPVYTRHAALGADTLQATEWLLTDGRGGFSMGTALGVPTRRYHALLIASRRPPVQRLALLNALVEQVVLDAGTATEQAYDLSTLLFADRQFHPEGHRWLVRFEKLSDGSCLWQYQAGPVHVTKEVHLFRAGHVAGEDGVASAVAIRYSLRREGVDRPVRLRLRPLVSLRDFHSLLRAGPARTEFACEPGARAVRVSRRDCTLDLHSDGASFTRDEQWWYDFHYAKDAQRWQDHIEDLFSPGVFVLDVPGSSNTAQVTIHAGAGEPPPGTIEHDRALRAQHLRPIIAAATASFDEGWNRTAALALAVASDDFVVQQSSQAPAPAASSGPAAPSTTVLAGYPWFADWGRDTFISLPGLLLATGRHAEAMGALRRFAGACRRGIIPNLFDEHTDEPQYNTVDASLWFVHAAFQYQRATGDRRGFAEFLKPACFQIVDHYRRGTDFNIAMDPLDSLITAGNPATQLTWMDARCDGVTFTPRHGKCVEINALWYNALLALAHAIVPDAPTDAANLTDLAAAAGRSFRASFWNADLKCCFDRLVPPDQPTTAGGPRAWVPSPELRPNQILAASLEYSPLSREQRAAVVRIVQSRLQTPCGVRTLDPADPAYRGRYEGSRFARDGAYHNGTAWPWLLGPLAEAILRADGFSDASRAAAHEVLRPLVDRLDGDCPGQLPEVLDGDHTPDRPQQANGCPAQAWSVAEALRVVLMIERTG